MPIDPSKLKVLMVSKKDQGGSGQQFVNALRAGGVDAQIAVMVPHIQYGYEVDFVMTGGRAQRVRQAAELLRGADIIHYKGDHLPGFGWLSSFNNSRDIAVVQTFGGSGFRRREGTHDRTRLEWHPIDAYRKRLHAMSAITPDLLYEPDITLLPHAHQERPYRWQKHRRIVIGHSPSDRDKKGTETTFLPAIEILRSSGYDIEVMMIEGVDNKTCVEMKAHCSIFFDQAVCSAYGNSAVEAMMMGIPVVTRMDDHVIDRDPAYRNAPVSFFDGDCPHSAAGAIEFMIRTDLEQTSRLTREWAGGLHSYSSSFVRLMELYERAIANKALFPIKKGSSKSRQRPR